MLPVDGVVCNWLGGMDWVGLGEQLSASRGSNIRKRNIERRRQCQEALVSW